MSEQSRTPPFPPPIGTERQLDWAATERHKLLTWIRSQQRQPAAVAEICRRLDGLPLAIELAAARLRVLTATGLALMMLGAAVTPLVAASTPTSPPTSSWEAWRSSSLSSASAPRLLSADALYDARLDVRTWRGTMFWVTAYRVTPGSLTSWSVQARRKIHTITAPVTTSNVPLMPTAQRSDRPFPMNRR